MTRPWRQQWVVRTHNSTRKTYSNLVSMQIKARERLGNHRVTTLSLLSFSTTQSGRCECVANEGSPAGLNARARSRSPRSFRPYPPRLSRNVGIEPLSCAASLSSSQVVGWGWQPARKRVCSAETCICGAHACSFVCVRACERVCVLQVELLDMHTCAIITFWGGHANWCFEGACLRLHHDGCMCVYACQTNTISLRGLSLCAATSWTHWSMWVSTYTYR